MDELVVLASTHVDRQGDASTKEALDDWASKLPEEPMRLTVEHDITLPPWGRMARAEVIPDGAGEYYLIGVQEAFPVPRPITLPDGTVALELGSDRDETPLTSRGTVQTDGYAVAFDIHNFEGRDDLRAFLQELRDIAEFRTAGTGRKALVPDPEILLQLPAWLFAGDMARRALGPVADRLGEDLAEDTHRAYVFLTRAAAALLRHARPKGRPATCVYYTPTDPRVEFVVRHQDARVFAQAVQLPRFRELYQEATGLKEALGATEVQYLYSEDGGWRFNYLLTDTGRVIGTPAAVDRTRQELRLHGFRDLPILNEPPAPHESETDPTP